jgi:hypothetical protein
VPLKFGPPLDASATGDDRGVAVGYSHGLFPVCVVSHVSRDWLEQNRAKARCIICFLGSPCWFEWSQERL